MDNTPLELYQILLEFKVGSSTYFRYADELFYTSLEDELLKQKVNFYEKEKTSPPGDLLLGNPKLINYYIITSDIPVVDKIKI